MYRVNVSSVQDFMQCRFRWWAKWVMNRVPIATAPALDAGKLLHRIFEDYFTGEAATLEAAAADQLAAFRLTIAGAHPASQPSALKAAQNIEDLSGAWELWQEQFKITEVLEVEAPFEWEDPVMDNVVWLGRPDRVVICQNRIWHYQNRGLAAGMNFGMYARLSKRHYHEHLYPLPLMEKYAHLNKEYGGTIFNLVRKLKFRTNIGKKNEAVKTYDEMFWQKAVSFNIKGPLHRSVMMALRQHVEEMRWVESMWLNKRQIPAPNEKMNGGYAGNSDDPYFRVLIGEVKLSDDTVFKAREDTYETAEATE